MQALRSVRRHFQDEATNEQRINFAPYGTSHKGKGKGKAKKGKSQSCIFRMVCLSSPSDARVPCSASAKEALLEAGLGEKKVFVPDMYCTSDTFRSVIEEQYPKLNGCGGYELLRCIANTRDLEAISQSIARSPKMLKAIVGNGRVFIRPIQQSLNLDPVEDVNSTPEVITILLQR